MIKLGVVLSLAFTIRTHASVYESKLLDKRLRSLIATSSSAEINAVVGTFSDVQNARLRCDVQLSGQRIPTDCFEVLLSERKVGLFKNSKLSYDWLESLCETRTKKSSDIAELRKASEADHLPSKCQLAVKERLLDLEYAAEAAKPAMLFNDRFSARVH